MGNVFCLLSIIHGSMTNLSSREKISLIFNVCLRVTAIRILSTTRRVCTSSSTRRKTTQSLLCHCVLTLGTSLRVYKMKYSEHLPFYLRPYIPKSIVLGLCKRSRDRVCIRLFFSLNTSTLDIR